MLIKQLLTNDLTKGICRVYNDCRSGHQITLMPTCLSANPRALRFQGLVSRSARLFAAVWRSDQLGSYSPPINKKLNKPCLSADYARVKLLQCTLPFDRSFGKASAKSIYNIVSSKYRSFLRNCALMLLISVVPVTANAGDIGNSMSEFWNDMGGSSNNTSGGSYEGQAAGHYSLGNVFARNKIKNKNFLSLQMPSHRAGCGGIDMFAGSFSYINADELIALFNSIASNAGAFAFKLALETMSPQIAEQVSELQAMIQKMNNFQINSCEQAAALVGGVWPKHDQASKSICASLGNRSGLFSDQAAANHGCSAGGQRASTLLTQNSSELKDVKVTNVNMAWNAIKDSQLFGVGSTFDRQMAEIFMTMSGTLIITAAPDDDTKGEYRPIAGQASSTNAMATLLDGGDMKVLRCDEIDECLNPTIDVAIITVPAEKAFRARVKDLLDTLASKIANEANGGTSEVISTEERALLNMTSIPIYKALNVSAAYSGSSAIFELHAYSEIIATDILFQYLNGIMKDIETASNTQISGDEKLLVNYRRGLSETKRDLASREHKKDNSVNTLLSLINRTTMVEKLLASKLNTSVSDTLEWSNSFK
jgi:conjugative transfer pilus assembly protein TraH